MFGPCRAHAGVSVKPPSKTVFLGGWCTGVEAGPCEGGLAFRRQMGARGAGGRKRGKGGGEEGVGRGRRWRRRFRRLSRPDRRGEEGVGRGRRWRGHVEKNGHAGRRMSGPAGHRAGVVKAGQRRGGGARRRPSRATGRPCREGMTVRRRGRGGRGARRTAEVPPTGSRRQCGPRPGGRQGGAAGADHSRRRAPAARCVRTRHGLARVPPAIPEGAEPCILQQACGIYRIHNVGDGPIRPTGRRPRHRNLAFALPAQSGGSDGFFFPPPHPSSRLHSSAEADKYNLFDKRRGSRSAAAAAATYGMTWRAEGRIMQGKVPQAVAALPWADTPALPHSPGFCRLQVQWRGEVDGPVSCRGPTTFSTAGVEREQGRQEPSNMR